MAAGHPLTDEDRWPWLDTIAAWIDERVAAGEPAVVTCSALKKIYRDKLRRQGVVFVYMQGTFDEVMERLSHRQGHFMKPSMLQSQSDILEEPGDDEIHVNVHIGQADPEHEAMAVAGALGLSHLSAPLSLTSPHVRRIDELERRISELQLELKQCEGQQGRTGSVQTGYSGRPAQPVRSDRPN